MRWIVLALSLAFAGAPSPRAHGPRPEGKHAARMDKERRLGMGAMALRRNENLSALQAYRRQLAVSPDAPAPNVGFGRALARVGTCSEALDHLWPYVDTTPFTVKAAQSAQTCAMKLRLWPDAVYFGLRAVWIRPNDVNSLTNLAVTLARAGDDVSADEVLDRLANLPTGDRSLAATSAIALGHGDVDEFDALVTAARRHVDPGTTLRIMSAQAWLDLGDPVTALTLVHSKVRKYAPVALRAEAYRRLGETASGWSELQPSPADLHQGITPDAVRARLAVDDGDLALADEVLAPWDGVDDPELAASHWYVARARGDAAGEADWAERYGALQENPLRTLDDLIPWNAPTR